MLGPPLYSQSFLKAGLLIFFLCEYSLAEGASLFQYRTGPPTGSINVRKSEQPPPQSQPTFLRVGLLLVSLSLESGSTVTTSSGRFDHRSGTYKSKTCMTLKPLRDPYFVLIKTHLAQYWIRFEISEQQIKYQCMKMSSEQNQYHLRQRQHHKPQHQQKGHDQQYKKEVNHSRQTKQQILPAPHTQRVQQQQSPQLQQVNQEFFRPSPSVTVQ